jgi:hypothetical protein
VEDERPHLRLIEGGGEDVAPSKDELLAQLEGQKERIYLTGIIPLFPEAARRQHEDVQATEAELDRRFPKWREQDEPTRR